MWRTRGRGVLQCPVLQCRARRGHRLRHRSVLGGRRCGEGDFPGGGGRGARDDLRSQHQLNEVSSAGLRRRGADRAPEPDGRPRPPVRPFWTRGIRRAAVAARKGRKARPTVRGEKAFWRLCLFPLIASRPLPVDTSRGRQKGYRCFWRGPLPGRVGDLPFLWAGAVDWPRLPAAGLAGAGSFAGPEQALGTIADEVFPPRFVQGLHHQPAFLRPLPLEQGRWSSFSWEDLGM